MTRRPRRVWSDEYGRRARESLRALRSTLGALSVHAPFGSPEYRAISNVMQVTADALEAFGENVMIWPADP